MIDDIPKRLSYAELMNAETPHLLVKLDTRDPIEVADFVSAFTSVAHQYEQFIRDARPDIAAEARVYVREVRTGCIEAELIPIVKAMAGLAITTMDQVTIIDSFAKFYARRLAPYFNKGGRASDASKSDLKDFMGGVAAIANDPDGCASLSTAIFEDGERKIRAALTFTTSQARVAEAEIAEHKKELEHVTAADHIRVLMSFYQSNVKSTAPGKRTGEMVMIEAVHPRPLPLIYASDLAEQRIKHEIKEADENVYKRGFVVDVNVELRNGKPAAYRVTECHQVIDLPD